MESPRHRQLKQQVGELFAAAGWTVDYEAQGPDWRADVLVQRDQRRAAIEIELSNPSYQSMLRRQERYRRSGITAIWITGRQPREGQSCNQLPFFPLVGDDHHPEVNIDDYRRISLSDLLHGLIDQRLSWRDAQIDLQRSAALVTFASQCWFCDRQFTAIRGIKVPTCRCGLEVGLEADLDEHIFAREALLHVGCQRIQPTFGPLANLRKRGTSIRPDPYLANHCPHCRRVQGDFYLQLPTSDAYFQGQGEVFPITVPAAAFASREDYYHDRQHWCLSSRLIEGQHRSNSDQRRRWRSTEISGEHRQPAN